ncbi:MAG: MFS transporter [Acidobacteriota bacterium]|nr:MAG: MFS transporter [Acidobacteriota bacterium]
MGRHRGGIAAVTAFNRVEIVERNLDRLIDEARAAPAALAPEAPLAPGSSLTASKAIELFEDQVLSRSLDVAARELKKRGLGFYTISSAGHEQNAVLGALLRRTDPCFLHYRSGALMMARARKLPGSTPAFDTLLSFCACAEDPASGGRHKVWGSRELWVPPQTSTIGSHLPKAVGLAFSLSRARRLRVDSALPRDTIVCCSFGDATVNHAAALAGFNAARYSFRQGQPTPILFVCEDNGRGISVETPVGWIEDLFAPMRHLSFFTARGEIDEVWDTVSLAIRTCRKTRGPVFVHLPCVRLWGHAGTDVESSYRTLAEIEATEAQDPLLRNAQRLMATGAASPASLRALVDETRARVAAAAEEATCRQRLSSRAQIVAPLAPYDEQRCREAASETLDDERRRALFDGTLPELATGPTRRTMAAHINAALIDEMLRCPEIVVFGEDVGRTGGVYNVTQQLQRIFGPARVFDTLLDETTILGVAQGAAQIGLLPIPEIQYLAYVHNAIDQLRGEACSQSFFSDGRFRNPMVVRIASFAYQKGFGGHFHNDNGIGALREIPGLVLAAPARGDDAARMLRGAVALARECGRIVCLLEPIALYHERDLYESGDRGWLFDYPPPGTALLPGEVAVYHEEHENVLIVSYGNGVRLSLRAAALLRERHRIAARVIDLRWLNPLPHEAVRAHAAACRKVLVVDECRHTGGGIAEAVIASLAEQSVATAWKSVRAADSYVPLGPAAELVLVSEDDIVDAARELCT